MITALMLSILSAVQTTQPAPQPTDQQLAWLKALPACKRVIYQWPSPPAMLGDPRFLEVTRITGTVALDLKYDEPTYQAAGEIAKQHGAKVCLHASPWHTYVVPAGNSDPTAWDDASRREMAWTSERIRTVSGWCAKFGIAPAEIFLDTEFYYAKADAPENAMWNDALRRRWDTMYQLFRAGFPTARVHWFRFGSRNLGLWSDDDLPPSWFTGREQSDSYSCYLYGMTRPYQMGRELRLTLAAADKAGKPVFAWICPGSNVTYEFDEYRYVPGADYPLDYSWIWGLIATRAPMDRATWVIYPGLGYEGFGTAAYECEWRHFVAFIRGWHRIRELDDLGSTTQSGSAGKE